MIVPPSDPEQARERTRRGGDGGEAKQPGRHRGAYYGQCPLLLQRRSPRRSKPLTRDPTRGAVFCDVDGVLAPIVQRPEDAHVREETSVLLGRLARRYACVACISGRAAADVRRLVGVGGIAYAGSHGAELLEPGSASPRTVPAFKSWEERVKRFAADRRYA